MCGELRSRLTAWVSKTETGASVAPSPSNSFAAHASGVLAARRGRRGGSRETRNHTGRNMQQLLIPISSMNYCMFQPHSRRGWGFWLHHCLCVCGPRSPIGKGVAATLLKRRGLWLAHAEGCVSPTRAGVDSAEREPRFRGKRGPKVAEHCAAHSGALCFGEGRVRMCAPATTLPLLQDEIASHLLSK